MPEMRRLYVIGNGFDLHHGIRSSYSNFRAYIRENAQNVWAICEDFLPADENWSDLEEALGQIDTDHLLSTNEHFLVPYGANKWSDADHHGFEWAINEASEALSSNLLVHFMKWISELYIPDACESDSVLRIDRNATFLSFNYTETLLKIYGVCRERICFPHGFIGDSDPELILGHAWTPENKMVERIDEQTDTRVSCALSIIDNYFKSTFKPSKELLNKYSNFFESLADIEEVIVLGHSLHEVDHPYFEEIISKVPDKADWVFSYFGAIEPVKNKIELLGLSESITKLVTLDEIRKGA